jgi:translation initiation factor 3 subunit B
MSSTNGIVHESTLAAASTQHDYEKQPTSSDDDIDYSDIEAKYVNRVRFLILLLLALRYQVHFDDGFDNTLVVDGVPIIDKSKLDKLLAKIAKEFSRKGAPVKVDDIFVPWDDTKDKSKGCVLRDCFAREY